MQGAQSIITLILSIVGTLPSYEHICPTTIIKRSSHCPPHSCRNPVESGGIKIWQRALPILPFRWVLHSSGMGGGMVIPVEHVPEWHRTGMQLESSGIFHRNDNELNQ